MVLLDGQRITGQVVASKVGKAAAEIINPVYIRLHVRAAVIVINNKGHRGIVG